MDRKNILEIELNSFTQKVKQEYHPEKIILFGSFASGKINESSDLDVVVVAESKDNFWDRLMKISKLCSHKIGMDVLFYTPEEFDKLIKTRTFFKKEILEKGEIIYDKAGTA